MDRRNFISQAGKVALGTAALSLFPNVSAASSIDDLVQNKSKGVFPFGEPVKVEFPTFPLVTESVPNYGPQGLSGVRIKGIQAYAVMGTPVEDNRLLSEFVEYRDTADPRKKEIKRDLVLVDLSNGRALNLSAPLVDRVRQASPEVKWLGVLNQYDLHGDNVVLTPGLERTPGVYPGKYDPNSSKVFRINLATSEITRVSKTEAGNVKLADDLVVFEGGNTELYARNLDLQRRLYTLSKGLNGGNFIEHVG